MSETYMYEYLHLNDALCAMLPAKDLSAATKTPPAAPLEFSATPIATSSTEDKETPTACPTVESWEATNASLPAKYLQGIT